MLVCQLAVDDLQSWVDEDKSQMLIEKCEADWSGSDQLQQLKLLVLQLNDSIAQAVHCFFIAGIHQSIRSFLNRHLLYAIPRRLNTGTLAKSTTNAKIAAARSVPPTTNIDKGLMAIPRVTKVEMIKISQTVETTTQRLGRELHSRWRSRMEYSVASLPNTSAIMARVLSVSIPNPM